MNFWNRRNSIGWRQLFAAWFVCAAAPMAVLAAPGDLLLSIPNPDGIVGARFGESVAEFQGNILVGTSYTPVGDLPFGDGLI